MKSENADEPKTGTDGRMRAGEIVLVCHDKAHIKKGKPALMQHGFKTFSERRRIRIHAGQHTEILTTCIDESLSQHLRKIGTL